MLKTTRIYYFILSVIFIILQGCASSAVTREAASNVDAGYQNANSMIDNSGTGSLAEGYQNTSQMTKGVVIGGVVGGVAGGATSGIGVVPGLLSGAILGGAFGAYLDGYSTLRDKLENRDVKVIILGDQVLLVVQSSHVFQSMTPVLRPEIYSTLDLVVKLINTYPNMMVQVAAYTNASGPERINRSLTQQQADSVAKYLWQAGVNTRMLYATGYGGTHLVEKNTIEWNNSENYRIEITLEKLPV